METLAHFGSGGGPGPWILLFPLIWAAVVVGGITLLRRTVWRGRRGPWRPDPRVDERSPIAVLGRRFAAGEIDEDEYWRRLSVLNEEFGKYAGGGKGGAA
ncbi:SHOCT domain-containing protein [Streptomyces sp. VRA16 Mangrove soil]|uniref:SHOCT domain-containing protein n=1 Tax=Streptomyces sp. VRA16 Mangrove soil TaxID=2817434 RepID=UPI001A9E2B05|nr:SHOCT domain-containing protein [Streptomyces sp. VRA16 Mangrove soil]MBO1334441.1 SHOCT domain-containing protein [Streptomyces sp. VRA16 Mangrove soil]